MSTLSDIFNALPGLSDLMPGVSNNQGMMSSIDNEAGMEITFSEYPRNSEYVQTLIEKMKEMIKGFNI